MGLKGWFKSKQDDLCRIIIFKSGFDKKTVSILTAEAFFERPRANAVCPTVDLSTARFASNFAFITFFSIQT